MNANRHEIVEECLELLRLGTSLEECLTRYPDDAEELEPILRTAVSARSDLALDLPPATRARLRDRVMSEWDRRQEPKRWNMRIPSPFPSLAPFPDGRSWLHHWYWSWCLVAWEPIVPQRTRFRATSCTPSRKYGRQHSYDSPALPKPKLKCTPVSSRHEWTK